MMSDEDPQITEIIKMLPQTLQNRFNSLGNYVRSVVAELEENKNRRINREDISIIHLAVFIYSLNWFLREGTRAAEASINTLETLGLDGFSIGSTVFTKDNENTLRGRDLAEELMKHIGDSPLAIYIKGANNMRSLIRDLRDMLSHA